MVDEIPMPGRDDELHDFGWKTAPIGSGLLSTWLLVLRAGIAEPARRRWRRHP